MDIVSKLNELNERFNKIQGVIQSRENEVSQLRDEQKRLQGEYRLLVEMGKEQGIIDENGNIVQEEG